MGLGLSSPCNFEARESSFSGLNVLETSHWNCLANPSLSRSETTDSKKIGSSNDSPTTAVMLAMSPKVISDTSSSVVATKVAGEGGQHSPTHFAPSSTVPIGPEEVAHASHDPVSATGDLSGSMLVLVVSSATMSSTIASTVTGANSFGGPSLETQSYTMSVKPVGVVQASSESVIAYSDPMVSTQVSLTSQVATEDGEEDFVGSEGSATTKYDSDSEGVHLHGPTIRELVGDLDKSWGNSKDWMLQLRDGRQLVLPLSLYRYPNCMSVCSSLEGECVPGNASITNAGQRVS